MTILILVIAVAVVMLAAGTILLNGWGSRNAGGANGSAGDMGTAELTATHYVQIDVKDYGTITAELYGDTAPVTVDNFIRLAGEGFYDGLTFHRIISGFMIQGGDPNGNGTGGSGRNIKGEFSGNGVQNDIRHVRGVLSMARSNAPDSASSQFFIMHQDAPHLDGAYAAFGKVLTGMEVVDAICQKTPVTDRNGTVARANQPVITSIKVIEKPAE
ncbi:MAG: peptidylprolyl isomerase [Clostridia bacterium]|nr:peptidylprolyl isomerase [Clostridia bacterium]